MSSLSRRAAVALLSAALAAPVAVQAARPTSTAGVVRSAQATPELIEADVAAGRIARLQGDIHLAQALARPAELPRRYVSTAPWRGTRYLQEIKERNPSRSGPIFEILGASVSTCSSSVTPATGLILTEHFRVEYVYGTIVGLTAQEYADSLETAWVTQVDQFGWAAPPITDPGDRYLVRIDPALGPGLYGFVSSEERVGDNPNTPWDDQEAYSSCMAVNSDFATFFPGTPQQALDATTAHEFNHSIQFGLGALTGNRRPGAHFSEGGATWMEDEVFDAADDNHNYLWPRFDQPLIGSRQSYPYWIVWRGITERFGSNQPGGGEQVMQEVWEAISRDGAKPEPALAAALSARGIALSTAFHDLAVAVRLLAPCGIVSSPYCLEEGPLYRAQAGDVRYTAHVSPGEPYDGGVEWGYAANHVGVIADGPVTVDVANTATSGDLRVSVACIAPDGTLRFGAGPSATPGPFTLGAGQSAAVPFDATGCSPSVTLTSDETGDGFVPYTVAVY